MREKKIAFSLISGECKLFSLLKFCELQGLFGLEDTVQKPV